MKHLIRLAVDAALDLWIKIHLRDSEDEQATDHGQGSLPEKLFMHHLTMLARKDFLDRVIQFGLENRRLMNGHGTFFDLFFETFDIFLRSLSIPERVDADFGVKAKIVYVDCVWIS